MVNNKTMEINNFRKFQMDATSFAKKWNWSISFFENVHKNFQSENLQKSLHINRSEIANNNYASDICSIINKAKIKIS